MAVNLRSGKGIDSFDNSNDEVDNEIAHISTKNSDGISDAVVPKFYSNRLFVSKINLDEPSLESLNISKWMYYRYDHMNRHGVDVDSKFYDSCDDSIDIRRLITSISGFVRDYCHSSLVRDGKKTRLVKKIDDKHNIISCLFNEHRDKYLICVHYRRGDVQLAVTGSVENSEGFLTATTRELSEEIGIVLSTKLSNHLSVNNYKSGKIKGVTYNSICDINNTVKFHSDLLFVSPSTPCENKLSNKIQCFVVGSRDDILNYFCPDSSPVNLVRRHNSDTNQIIGLCMIPVHDVVCICKSLDLTFNLS